MICARSAHQEMARQLRRTLDSRFWRGEQPASQFLHLDRLIMWIEIALKGIPNVKHPFHRARILL